MHTSLLTADQPAVPMGLFVAFGLIVALVEFTVPLFMGRPRRRASVWDALLSLLLGALAGPTFWVMTQPAVMVWIALALPVFFVAAVAVGYRLLRR
ncbi:hypothetical protein ACFV6F_16065 [Kitasatospora phosalacinea]|uniref:hypothetical protein n=1 Tax=Kitasatospora phosalacinea TaxID=2065 RepID=UPI00365B9E59